MTDVYLAVGHGVEPNGVFDPGAVGADGTQEHTLCTVVCTAAAAALNRSGVSFQWESNAGAGHDPDYRGSVDIANRLGVKIAVEVHFDANNAPRGGFGIYHSDASPARNLAVRVGNLWSAAGFPTRPSYADVRGLYFLKATRMPALIWECDRTMAQPDPSMLIRMGDALAHGICDFIGAPFGGSPVPAPTGGPVDPDMRVNIIGQVVSQISPPEGGVILFTDAGFVYAWGAAQYHGGPAADPATHWVEGKRVGAQIRLPGPGEGPHYVCIDTAGEKYSY